MKRILIFATLGLFVCVSFAQNTITLEEIWKNYAFSPSGVPGFNTFPDSDFYTLKTKTSIDKHKFVNGEKVYTLLSDDDLIAAQSFLRIQKINDFSFDKTEKKVLLSYQMKSIYRRSTKAFYYIVDLNKHIVKPLSDTTKGKQSFATFSPDGRYVAFVRYNNLFVVDLEQETETQIGYMKKN